MVEEEDLLVLVEQVVHGMDLHYFLVDHILVRVMVLMQLLTMQELTQVLVVVADVIRTTDMVVTVVPVSFSSLTQPDKYLKT